MLLTSKPCWQKVTTSTAARLLLVAINAHRSSGLVTWGPADAAPKVHLLRSDCPQICKAFNPFV
ncbi:hypothetical protein DIPPA_10291 [Diplonema papillatum]|nr:hypothetical protein DIPPA_10291 [Diplonema papillatum]